MVVHMEAFDALSRGQQRCCANVSASNPRCPLLHGEMTELVAEGRQYPGKAEISESNSPSFEEQSAPSGQGSHSFLSFL
jgi:hypothetical protein